MRLDVEWCDFYAGGPDLLLENRCPSDARDIFSPEKSMPHF